MPGKRVGQLRVIFKIPDAYLPSIFGASVPPPGNLAYIEWFLRPRRRDKNHSMFPVSRSYKRNGDRDVSVVQLDRVLRPCQLAPKFGVKADRGWTPDNVLERCEHFFINHFGDLHLYQTAF